VIIIFNKVGEKRHVEEVDVISDTYWVVGVEKTS